MIFRRIFRWQGLWVFGIFFFLLYGYWVLFFDQHLKALIEHYASLINGAKVEIGGIETKLLKGTVELKNIQIAHHARPVKNLLEIDRISLEFLFAPIQRNKIIIDKMRVEGIRYRTDREESGRFYTEGVEFLPTSAFLDRIYSGFSNDIKNQINDNPLKTLGTLLNGLDLQGHLLAMNDLDSSKKLKETALTLPNYLKPWSDLMRMTSKTTPLRLGHVIAQTKSEDPVAKKETLQKITENVDQHLNQMSLLKVEAQQKTALFYQLFKELDSTLDTDIKNIKSKIKLPNLDHQDLTTQLFGQKVIGFLERIAYWIDFSRRRMPRGIPKNKFTTMVAGPFKGSAVFFGKLAGFPSFLLRECSIVSESADDPHRGKISGLLSGLTNEPSVYGRPTQFQIEFEFPRLSIEKSTASVQIDHTQSDDKESIQAEFSSFPIQDWKLLDAPDIKLSIVSATASVKFTMETTASGFKANIASKLSDVEYHVSSQYKSTEEELRAMIIPIRDFDINGDIGGTFENITLNITSELGTSLAFGLQSEFKHQMAAIDDTIRYYLLEKILPEKSRLLGQVQQMEEEALRALDKQLKLLTETRKLAEEELASINKPHQALLKRRGLKKTP